jgi:hypothetical protein
MNTKKGFIFQYGTAKQIRRLIQLSGPEAAVGLLEALEAYSMDGTEPEDIDPVAEIIFEGMRGELDRDREKYEARVEQNRQNNEKKKKKSPVEPSGAQWGPMGTDSRQKTEDSRQEIEIKDSNAGAEPLIGLPLNDGSEHPVTQEDFNEYAALYPAVDVMQELRDMRGWLLANPSRKKTKRGIKAFIRTWLSKEQDRPTARSGTKTTRQMTAEEILAIPTFNPWTEAAQ